MKKIEAVFTPQKLDEVRGVLSEFGLEQFVVSELSAHEPELNKWRWGSDWHPDFRPRLRLEVVVDNETATEAARAILRAARTRYPVESAVTISTVEEVVEIADDQPTAGQIRNPPASAHAPPMNRQLINAFRGPGGRGRLVEALKVQPLIRDNDLAEVFANRVKLEEVPFGSKVITQGSPNHDLIFILIGEFFVSAARQVIRRKAGEHVGEMAVVDREELPSATVTAVSDSIVARISDVDFSTIAEHFPCLWRRIAWELAHHLKRATRHGSGSATAATTVRSVKNLAILARRASQKPQEE